MFANQFSCLEGDQDRNLQALTFQEEGSLVRYPVWRIFIILVPGKVSIFRLLGSTKNFRPEVPASTRKFLQELLGFYQEGGSKMAKKNADVINEFLSTMTILGNYKHSSNTATAA